MKTAKITDSANIWQLYAYLTNDYANIMEDISRDLRTLFALSREEKDFLALIDDGLTDHLVAEIPIDLEISKAVLDSVASIDEDCPMSAYLLHLRLLSKILACDHNLLNKDVFHDFAGRCWRHVKLSDNLPLMWVILQTFELCERYGIDYCMKEEIMRRASSIVCNRDTSIYVQNVAQKYLLSTFLTGDQTSSLLEPIVDTFCCADHFFLESISDFLLSVVNYVPNALIDKMIQAAGSKQFSGQKFARLIAFLMNGCRGSSSISSISEWKSEKVKLDIIAELVILGDKDLLYLILDERNTDLGLLNRCIPYLTEQEKNCALQLWIPRFSDSKFVASSIARFLEIFGKLSTKDSEKLYLSLFNRFMQSPILLEICLNKLIDNGRNKINELVELAAAHFNSYSWESRDAALQISHIISHSEELHEQGILKCIYALVDDSSDFVRSSALKLLSEMKVEESILFENAVSVLQKHNGSDSKLVALQILIGGLPKTLCSLQTVLSVIVEVCDDCILLDLVANAILKISEIDSLSAKWSKRFVAKCEEDGFYEELLSAIDKRTNPKDCAPHMRAIQQTHEILEEILAHQNLATSDYVKDCY